MIHELSSKKKLSVFILLLVLVSLWAASCAHQGVKKSPKKAVPEYEVLTTKKGYKVYYFPAPQVPIFRLELVFSQGALVDPPKLSGSTVFMSYMLKKGSGQWNENQISEEFDNRAGAFDVNVGEKTTSISLTGLNTEVTPLVDFSLKILAEPAFPLDVFKRSQKNYIQQLEQTKDDSAAIASRAFLRSLYKGRADFRPSNGLLKDIQRLNPAELRQRYCEVFSRKDINILFLGGKDKKEILAPVLEKIDQWVSHLACKTERKFSEAEVLATDNLKKHVKPVVFIHREGVPDAHVFSGFLGPKRSVGEFYGLEVAEVILGGPFMSRLNQVLREKNNWSYFVSSEFTYGRDDSVFIISSSTAAVNIGKFLAELKKQLKKFTTDRDFTEQELGTAKSYIVGKFPMILQDQFVSARMFFGFVLEGVPESFLDQYVDNINKVDLNGLKKAVELHFPKEELLTVVVGDRKKIVPQLQSSKIDFEERTAQEFL